MPETRPGGPSAFTRLSMVSSILTSGTKIMREWTNGKVAGE
jgi:hypothetical protein